MTRSTRMLAATFLPIALLCLASSAWSADGYGKLSGVVVDPSGTPQMGATIWLSPETIGSAAAQLLTNQDGVFGTSRLRPGLYSVRVTLAGFLPALQQHVRIQADLTTLIGVQLQSVLASFDQLRRPPPQPSETDDWKWVLRSASATRPILQWIDGTVLNAGAESPERRSRHQPRVRVEMTTGGRPSGLASSAFNTPATAVSYDQTLGRAGRLLLAGQMSFSPLAGNGLTLASIWVPSGEYGRGPETTFVMRQETLEPSGRSIRQMRVEHSEQMSLSDRVAIDYGAEYLMAAGPYSSAVSLRPRARVLVQVSPQWIAAFSVETAPGAYALRRRNSSLESALDALDTMPDRVWKDGNSAIEGGWHKEFALRREVGSRGSLELSAFHDLSKHQAVFGFNTSSRCDLPMQQYCSTRGYTHDAGAGGSWGTRAVYQQRISDNMQVAAIYAYAGALTPVDGVDSSLPPSDLEDRLHNEYRHSVAGRISGKLPGMSTRLSASYKWMSGGPVVSRQDAFGEAALGVDPNLSVSVRHPLPSFLTAAHWEALVDFRNVLSQGYVSMDGQDGQMVFVQVPRAFRGGLSVQF